MNKRLLWNMATVVILVATLQIIWSFTAKSLYRQDSQKPNCGKGETEQLIKEAVLGNFKRPNIPQPWPKVTKVAVVTPYALAEYHLREGGLKAGRGQIVLIKKRDCWIPVFDVNGTGQAIGLDTVIKAGVPSDIARTLMNRVNPPTATQIQTEQQVNQAVLNHITRFGNLDVKPHITTTGIRFSYALVSWRQEEVKGQTVLIKKRGTWHVVYHGEGAVDINTLKASGVPLRVAQILLDISK